MITGHGDDIFQYPDVRYNFSSNVYPFGPSLRLKEHLRQCVDKIGCYPSPLAGNLVELIARKEEVTSSKVLVTSGAVEAFYLIAELFAGKRSLIFTPSFSEYEDACLRFGHCIEFRPHCEASTADYSTHDLVWICNPNNPDGAVYDTAFLCQKIKEHPATLFVVDEAYIEFTKCATSLVPLVQEHGNIVVVKSMTKRYAIPGLRLGYLMAGHKITDALKRMVMPWRINTLAIEAGIFCLQERDSEPFPVGRLLDESLRVQQDINRLKGFRVCPSSTTFFLVEGPVEASILKNRLAEEHGILIRDASNFRGLGERHFRVSVRAEEENNILINVLKQWS
jgi:threonine-phosphate decarboxylase